MLFLIPLLALTAAVQAVPLSANSSLAHSVQAIHNKDYVRNGTAALLYAYAKHGLTPSHPVSEAFMTALRKRQDGSVTSVPDGGIEYLTSVTVGGQKLTMDFDTGSSDFWVFSSLMSTAQSKGHSIYTSSKSKTFKALSGATWDISFGDGSSASGTVGTDTVTIGKTVVTAQAVEMAKTVSSTFVSGKSDGLVGLAFSSINTVKPTSQKTFFDNAQKSLQAPMFAAFLPASKDGTFDFGATVAAHHTGTIEFAKVIDSNGFWEYASTSMKVGSTVHAMTGFTGISDTGTTLILMGDTAVKTYYAAVQGATLSEADGGYTFPCTATLPTLSFRIGATAYATIPAKLLNFAPGASGSTCFGALQSVGTGKMNIYGDVFFNAYYGVFDATGPQFGFAPIGA